MTTEKKNNNKMILSASAFNSCMIDFSIPDFKETIIKNIISLFLSFLNTEPREVVFRTQWFISQYCSEREGRGYRCRCTSVQLRTPKVILFSIRLYVFRKRRITLQTQFNNIRILEDMFLST